MSKTKDNIYKLVDDLYWDYDRMSTSGQQTLDKLSDALDFDEDAIWAHQELLDQEQQEEEDGN